MSAYPILIVEDKDSLRTMLRLALEAHSHTVLEAGDESEAIEQLRKTRPVVVLTDLKLPVGDGLGVLRAAKELDADLPVVVMTAYGSIQDAVTAMREGAMDFLAKPIESSVRSSGASCSFAVGESVPSEQDASAAETINAERPRRNPRVNDLPIIWVPS